MPSEGSTGRVREDGELQLAGPYSREDGERILREGSFKDLQELRLVVTESLGRIEIQLEEHRVNGGDNEWAIRARKAAHAYRMWLSRITTRLSDFNTEQPRSAVVIKGAGSTAEKGASAINALVTRGCRVFAFAAIGPDLLVLATEPRKT